MRSLGLTLVLALWAVDAGAQTPVATIWRAKGLEALDRLDAIKGTTTPPHSPARYSAMIDVALAFHVKGNGGDTPQVHFVSRDQEFFHVLLSAEEGLFDLVYVYARGAKDGELPSAVRIDHLPKGWKLVLLRKAEGKAMLVSTADDVSMLFSLVDPFDYRVFANELEPKRPQSKGR